MKEKKMENSLKVPIILGSIALLSGIAGFCLEVQTFTWSGMEKAIYKTLQLVQFEFDPDGYGNLIQNPFLCIARWLGPLALIWTAVHAYFRLRREELKLKKVLKWQDHIIICGYGDIGKRLVENLVEVKKKKVVVIDPCIEKDHFYADEKPDCILIRQDANIDTSLKRAGLFNAKYLIAATGNDITNFSILADAKSLLANSKSVKFLTAFAHVDNRELISNVQDYPLFQLSDNNFDGRIFNADDLAARLVFRKHAPDKHWPVQNTGHEAVHILIVGFTQFAQSLLTHFARTCHFLNDVKTQITVIDSDIEKNRETYLSRFPKIQEVIDLQFIHCNTECLCEKDFRKLINKQPVSVIYMCQQNIITQQLSLNRIKEIWSNEVPVVVCQPRAIPVPAWVNEDNHYYQYDPFTEACTYDVIIDETLEKQAELFHNFYLERERQRFEKKMKDYKGKKSNHPDEEMPKSKLSIAVWLELSEELKQSNRSLADHLHVKLRAVSRKVASTSENGEAVSFPGDEKSIEPLANMEHRRWNADKFLAGWKYGKPRNDSLKIHDNLVSWKDLPEDIKVYDRENIKDIPEVLKDGNFKIVADE